MTQANVVRSEAFRDESLRQKIEHQVDFVPQHWVNGERGRTGWNLSRTKRVIDAGIAILVFLILSPLFIAIIAAVKLTSKGPIFFAQYRTGFMGRRFKMYKFRTMVHNAEEIKQQLGHLSHHAGDSPDFKIKKDPRITPIGVFLRKFSLDELPQIFNVLNGDMSVIGPRPTSFSVDKYEEHHLARLASLPGLTGIWQVSGRSNIDFNGRVILDRRYIQEQGPYQDFKILVKTPLAVLKGDGAY
ncbi:sugar transferase [Gammaproteobacteria bacterium 45_16_T64]|nr:sugar transferase [Gammaproteobacteria bacterium 45_16_T64]